jgi:hypothetical protein
LGLDVDEALRGRDQVDEQGLDLAHLAPVREAPAGPGDGDVDVAEGRLQLLGPVILALGRRGAVELDPRRREPAEPREVAEALGYSAVHRHDRVVPRLVDPARRRPPAPRLLVLVVARVPARSGDVDSPAKGHSVVDHEDLLMVARLARVRMVELELDVRAACPLA